jgi:hypothetical protein
MKFNIRKIASALASAAMLSSTIGFAAAASYPAPFIVGGEADAAVIVGSSSATAATDWAAAVDISDDLSGRVSTTKTTSTVSGGDAKTLASGTDLLYLNDDLAENVATITDTDLSTVLADGTFVDDDGTEYDYEQTISIGNSTNNGLAFSDSDNDLDDPVVHLMVSDSTSSAPFTMVANFKTAVNFTEDVSEGEELVLFGKTYTVGTATDSDSLVLLGGASETTINVGESVTVEVSGNSYEVSLAAISDATTPQASLSVNGESKTFTETQTKKIAGVDVYAKTIFRSGDNAGYVIVQLGSDKLTFEDGNPVQIGTDNDDIEGTLVAITGGVGAMTKLEVTMAASDSDENHVLEGESFVDPVFGTVSLDFVDLKNGPELDVHDDVSTTRNTLAITKEGDRELGVSVEVKGQDAVTLPFAYQTSLADDDGDTVHIVEGEDLDDEEYFILNAGNYQFFLQMTKVSLSESSDSDVHFKDLVTGETHTDLVDDNTEINETAGTTTTFTLNSQTFTVESVDSDTVKIYSSDYCKTGSGCKIDVFPIIELVDAKDHAMAYVDDVLVTNVDDDTIFNLPTGELTITGNSTLTSQAVGTVFYNITTAAHDADTTNVTIGVSSTLKSGGARETDPAVLFVEEEDKSESTSDTKNAILLATTDDASYSEAATPAFSGTSGSEYDSDGFDDSDYTGYLTNFGTYVLKDTSDSDQTVTSLTYGAEQMYGEIFVSETGATITPGSSGAGGQVSVYKDNEVNSVSGKNLIVVGGSCINTVAAKILDSTVPICTSAFTEETGVGPGQYIIKVVESPYNSDKIAMLVAGYEAAETVDAKGKVLEGVSTDIGEQVYPILN